MAPTPRTGPDNKYRRAILAKTVAHFEKNQARMQYPVDFLYQTFVAAARQGTRVDVLCIGGFTNFAMLLGERPLAEYQAGIGTLYAMAGAVNVPGNVVTSNDDTWGYYGNNTTVDRALPFHNEATRVRLTAPIACVD